MSGQKLAEAGLCCNSSQGSVTLAKPCNRVEPVQQLRLNLQRVLAALQGWSSCQYAALKPVLLEFAAVLHWTVEHSSGLQTQLAEIRQSSATLQWGNTQILLNFAGKNNLLFVKISTWKRDEKWIDFVNKSDESISPIWMQHWFLSNHLPTMRKINLILQHKKLFNL